MTAPAASPPMNAPPRQPQRASAVVGAATAATAKVAAAAKVVRVFLMASPPMGSNNDSKRGIRTWNQSMGGFQRRPQFRMIHATSERTLNKPPIVGLVPVFFAIRSAGSYRFRWCAFRATFACSRGRRPVVTRRDFLAAAGAVLVTGAGAAHMTGAVPARGQGFNPDRPIRFIVGYPAGGGVDIVARLFGEPMKAALGPPVVVENRAGASGMVAAAAVAKAAPDGLTLLMAASGEVAINQHLYGDKMSYDPLRELIPVALIGIVPCVVVVAATTPVRNAAELVAYARAHRGKLSFSSSGIGNPQQLAGELMNSMAGTDMLHVPYRGSAPAVTDVATGAITMSFSSLAAAL